MKKSIQLDKKSNREFIQKRGHMLAFLLMALAGTMMINNLQEPVNEAITASYFQDV